MPETAYSARNSSAPSLLPLVVNKEFGGTLHIQIAKVPSTDDPGMGPQRMLGTVQEKIAEVGVRIHCEEVNEILREAVAHPHPGIVIPVIGP